MDRIARGDDGGARDFFDRYARDFDHIYDEGGKGALARFVDTKLRSEMRVRFEKTFEALTPLRGRSLLDAGCGGGRYVIPAAKAGASEVLGIDFSETMLALGRQKAAAFAASRSGICSRTRCPRSTSITRSPSGSSTTRRTPRQRSAPSHARRGGASSSPSRSAGTS